MRLSLRFPQLGKADFFANLSPRAVSAFLDSCTLHMAKDRHVILQQGADISGMALVAHGAVELSSQNDEGHRAILHHAREGAVLGCLEAVSERPGLADCVALGDVTYLWCPQDVLAQQMADPVFLRNVMRIACQQIACNSAWKLIDQNYPLDRRICAYLLHLAGKSEIVNQNQSYLAALTSCSRQSINRCLADLRKAGLIHVDKGVIRLLDRDGLQRRLAGR